MVGKKWTDYNYIYTEIMMKERFKSEKAYTLWYYLHKAQSNTVFCFVLVWPGCCSTVCLLWKFITLYTYNLSIFCIYVTCQQKACIKVVTHWKCYTILITENELIYCVVDDNVICWLWLTDQWCHSSSAHKKDQVVEITVGNFWKVLGWYISDTSRYPPVV